MSNPRFITRMFASQAFSLALALASPGIATGQEVAQDSQASQKFISDGGVVENQRLGIRITPPKGWEVINNAGALSMIIQEPKVELEEKNKDYSKPTFQRHITVAAIHHASPIDEMRAEELKKELNATFGKDPLVTDFKVLEHKFFNYRGENDGLIVYTQMNLREFQMMQMHILVSGDAKQFLLSYSDLATEFSKQPNAGYDSAWSSMVSLEVQGLAPKRFEKYQRYGVIGGGFLMLIMTMGILRRRSAKRNYLEESDDIATSESSARWNKEDSSMISTMAGEWRIGKHLDEPAIDFEDRHVSRTSRFANTFS